MLRAIFQFFFEKLKNAEFVCSVDKYLSVVKKRFLDEEEAENIKYEVWRFGGYTTKIIHF